MVLKGLPGCGKSTFAKELLKKEPERWKRFNRDDLRGMVDNHAWSKENEVFIVEIQETLVKTALRAGYDVVLDNTHLVPQTIKKIHKLAESIGDVKVIERGFNVSVSECLLRNAAREGIARVPDKVINDMARGAGIDKGRIISNAETYYEPRPDSFKVIVQDESLPKTIMCDLDGTLAIIGDRTPYDATDCDIKDLPNWPVIQSVLAMHAQGVKVMFMSGRDQKYRPETIRFIEKYCKAPLFGIDGPMRPIPYQLHMRGETAPEPDKADMRKDSIIKQELFDKYVAGKYNVQFVLDDRNQVVDFWRSIGLSCFQVAPGDF